MTWGAPVMTADPHAAPSPAGPLPSDPAVVHPVVVLVGPPGSGKSTVAQALADRLGLARRDTDHDVETGAGRTIPDIFATDGEAVFRAMETDALYTALRTHDGVLSLGGGAPLAAYNQELLAQYEAGTGLVVFLDVTPDVAVARMGDTHGRPLLGDAPRERFVALMADRREIYEKVASLHLDTSSHTVESVVDAIVAHLGSLTKDQH